MIGCLFCNCFKIFIVVEYFVFVFLIIGNCNVLNNIIFNCLGEFILKFLLVVLWIF